MVKVLNADAVPMPLRFDTLEQALAYVARTPGTLRIVEVGDEGERVPVDTERAVRRVAQGPVALRGRAAPGRAADRRRRGGRSGASGRTGPSRR